MFDSIKNYFRYNDIYKNRAKLAGFVSGCGADPTKVGKLFSHGMQHYIFEYGKDQVIKVPKFDIFNTLYGILRPSEVKSDWKIIHQFFQEYVVDTEVLAASDNGFYVIIQKKINKFENLTSRNIHKVIDEFQKLHRRNHILDEKLGYSLDLWGKSGIIKSFKKSFGRINVFVEMTNIIIDTSKKKPKVLIIDTNLYRTRGEKVTLSRLLTDKVIFLFSDYFLRRGKFLS